MQLTQILRRFGKGVWKVHNEMFVIRDGFLYYGKQLCIPQGHFGYFKTLKLILDNFYWPKLNRDVVRMVERCETCR